MSEPVFERCEGCGAEIVHSWGLTGRFWGTRPERGPVRLEAGDYRDRVFTRHACDYHLVIRAHQVPVTEKRWAELVAIFNPAPKEEPTPETTKQPWTRPKARRLTPEEKQGTSSRWER